MLDSSTFDSNSPTAEYVFTRPLNRAQTAHLTSQNVKLQLFILLFHVLLHLLHLTRTLHFSPLDIGKAEKRIEGVCL